LSISHGFIAPVQYPSASFRRGGVGSSELNAFEASQLLTAIDQFYETQPYVSAFVTCSLKASAADIVAQSTEEQDVMTTSTTTTTTTTTTTASMQKQKDEAPSRLDMQRNLGLTLYGGLYSGLTQQYLYNTMFPQIFGDGRGWFTVFEQVACDMLVLTPFLCLPVCYAVKASVAEGTSLPSAIQKYVSHVRHEGLLLKYWSLWIPVQCLTFGVIPQHLRIPFVALVSFFWFIILSNVSSQEEGTA